MYQSTEEIFAKINQKQNDANHYKTILSHNYDDIDKFISDQAKLRIKYKNKFTNLIDNKFIILPPNINCEQSSSEATASYKANIIKQLSQINSILDGTCGFGIDSNAFAKVSGNVIGIDTNKDIIQINNYNVSINNITNLIFENIDLELFLDSLITANKKTDFIYLDPARRDINGKKLFIIDELTPNIFTILNKLKLTTRYLMIKFSPLTDISYLTNNFDNIIQIDIIEYDKELKEILIIIDFDLENSENKKIDTKINLVDLNEIDDFNIITYNYTKNAEIIKEEQKIENHTFAKIDKYKYLYEPSTSEMKFAKWDMFNDLDKISNNTHLFLFNEFTELNNSYLGKFYEIVEVGAVDNKILQKLNINSANIKVRNSTIKVDDLYKKFKIKTGGDYYIFVFGNDNYKNKMIISKKIENNSQVMT